MSRQTRWLAVAAALSAVVGFGSFHAWRHLESTTVPATAGSPAPPVPRLERPVAGDEAPAGQPSAPIIPDHIPDVSLPDLQGRRHALASYQGHPTIFNFWASWCAPCLREIPLLNEIRHDTAVNRMQVVGIAADLESNVVKFLKTTRIDYDVLIGEHEGSEAAARFGVPLVLPFSVFVSAGGHVVAIKVGELHRDEAMAMLAAIRELDLGKRDLADTRLQIAARLRELAVERAKESTAGSG